MSYRQILATLEALPEGERQLAAYTYSFTDEDGKEVCGCVLGKAIPELRRLSGSDELFRAWQGMSATDATFAAAGIKPEAYGLDTYEALAAQSENDRVGTTSKKNDPKVRRARYSHTIEWLRARVAEEVTSIGTGLPCARCGAPRELPEPDSRWRRSAAGRWAHKCADRETYEPADEPPPQAPGIPNSRPLRAGGKEEA